MEREDQSVLQWLSIPEGTTAYLVQIPADNGPIPSSQKNKSTIFTPEEKNRLKNTKRTSQEENNTPLTKASTQKKVSNVEKETLPKLVNTHLLMYPVTFEDSPGKAAAPKVDDDERKRSSSPQKLMIVLQPPKVNKTESLKIEDKKHGSRNSNENNVPRKEIRKESDNKKHLNPGRQHQSEYRYSSSSRNNNSDQSNVNVKKYNKSGKKKAKTQLNTYDDERFTLESIYESKNLNLEDTNKDILNVHPKKRNPSARKSHLGGSDSCPSSTIHPNKRKQRADAH